jgi:hypothetical protein
MDQMGQLVCDLSFKLRETEFSAATEIARLTSALRTIRDSTYRNAVTLRGIADQALTGAEFAEAKPREVEEVVN